MRASTLHIVTYRDDPADAEIASHRLLARAGYIHKVGSGLYVYGPLLWRVLSKVQRILREELDAVGAVEIQAPILQERALWERSGRWEVYQASGTLFTTTGRRGGEYALAPTAEEVFTEYVAATARSYKQLPLCLYQVHTKFRDELRPRFGLMRVREFLMKDAYSFDADEAGLDAWYERMRGAYERFFARLGVQAFGVEADSGEIGGSGSMEFMVAASAGEDAILMEPGGAYAANVEKATSRLAAPAAEAARALRAVSTPGVRTIAELEGFFPEVPAARMVKTLLYEVRFADRFEPWAVLIRGDCELNPVKLRGHLGALEVTPLAPEQVGRLTGASPGFVGPVGLPEGVRVVADDSVRGLCNVVCGMNRDDTHAVDVNLGRDFPEPRYAELRLARAGEPGPVTGAPLEEVRGVEVGHIFKLGTKYSEAMGATFIDRDGKARPYVMGCYGVGVSRVVAAAVEQRAGEGGFAWPVSIAPFEVGLACLAGKDEELVALTEGLYAALKAAGVDALLDDRALSAGAKLKDLELLGLPLVVVVGRVTKQEGVVELRVQGSGEVRRVAPEALVEAVREALGS